MNTPSTIYDYTDANGRLLYQKVRSEGKCFHLRRPDPNAKDKYLLGLGDAERVLYNLPGLDKAGRGEWVFITEGEKDADSVIALGLCATTKGSASDRWLSEFSHWLNGHRVAILPDNDKPGRDSANDIARALVKEAADVRIVEMPGKDNPRGYDVSNWIEDLDSRTSEELRDALLQMVETAPSVKGADTPSPERKDAAAPLSTGNERSIEPVLICMADVKAKPVRWLWPGRVPLGKLTILDGHTSTNKSTLSFLLAALVSRGLPMPDGTQGDLTEPSGVVVLNAEDGMEDTHRPHLDATGADPTRIFALNQIRDTRAGKDSLRLPSLADIEAIRKAVLNTASRLVVVDPFAAYLSGADSYVDAEIRSLLAPLAQMAEETDAAVLLIRHLTKARLGPAMHRGGGSVGILAAARSALLLAEDPDDATRRVLASVKCNVAKRPPSLVFRVEEHTTEDGTITVPVLVYEGESDRSADSLVQAAEVVSPSAMENARNFLESAFAEKRVWDAQEITRQARAAGVSFPTLKRMKRELGISSVKRGQPGEDGQRWVWVRLSEGDQDTEGDQEKHDPLRGFEPVREGGGI